MEAQLKPVKSSFIQAIGYQVESKVLTIAFKRAGRTAGIYTYRGVKSVTATRLMKAPSKGRFFHANIRGHYPYKRVG